MKRILISALLCACALMLPSFAAVQKNAAPGNNEEGYAKEVYTGTLYGMNGRGTTVGFTLTLTSRTNDEEAQRYLQILASEGQEGLMKAIRKNKLGFMAATGQVGRDLLLVRESQVKGQRRIIAAFERWQRMFELRSGSRSLDYAFSIIEIYFDAKGRGTGTFIGLAEVKLERDKKTEQLRLELESFGSFPSKVMGVMRRK